LLLLQLCLPRARGETEHGSGDAQAIGDARDHLEGGDLLRAADDGRYLAWGQRAGCGDTVLAQAAVLLDQGEDGCEVVLHQRTP
jgi:hypothetical protein